MRSKLVLQVVGSKCRVSLICIYQVQEHRITTDDVGQVEFMFDYASGPVSASVDFDFVMLIRWQAKTHLEEAIITYDFGNGLALLLVKMLSYYGFEAMIQQTCINSSYAYDASECRSEYL